MYNKTIRNEINLTIDIVRNPDHCATLNCILSSLLINLAQFANQIIAIFGKYIKLSAACNSIDTVPRVDIIRWMKLLRDTVDCETTVNKFSEKHLFL